MLNYVKRSTKVFNKNGWMFAVGTVYNMKAWQNGIRRHKISKAKM